jgi:hypothetical protein
MASKELNSVWLTATTGIGMYCWFCITQWMQSHTISHWFRQRVWVPNQSAQSKGETIQQLSHEAKMVWKRGFQKERFPKKVNPTKKDPCNRIDQELLGYKVVFVFILWEACPLIPFLLLEDKEPPEQQNCWFLCLQKKSILAGEWLMWCSFAQIAFHSIFVILRCLGRSSILPARFVVLSAVLVRLFVSRHGPFLYYICILPASERAV